MFPFIAKIKQICIFFPNNLHISKNCSIFAVAKWDEKCAVLQQDGGNSIEMDTIEWINNREMHGMVTFSKEEISHELAQKSAESIHKDLGRLVAKGYIQSVFRGFYVIVPVQYRLKGIVPPSYFIDDLMWHLGKPYYVGLLSAAAMHGAGHQRAMQTQVMTVIPRLNVSRKDTLIDWNYRTEMPEELVQTRNGEMGVLRYSSPELTMVDMVQYADHVGGFQRAATVLAELVESVDMGKIEAVLPWTTVATMMRLGYILEMVLGEQEKADALYAMMKSRMGKKSWLLNPKVVRKESAASNRWHVNGNVEIEIDEI